MRTPVLGVECRHDGCGAVLGRPGVVMVDNRWHWAEKG